LVPVISWSQRCKNALLIAGFAPTGPLALIDFRRCFLAAEFSITGLPNEVPRGATAPGPAGLERFLVWFLIWFLDLVSWGGATKFDKVNERVY
jgi:hypothetical protein